MGAAARPLISVVIPSYQRPELLEGCLNSLSTQSVPSDSFEIAVVDDASGDATRSVLETAAERMPNLRWASQERNQGPAAARNRAVSLGSAPLILFIDDDIVATPNLVERHLHHHRDQQPMLGVVGHLSWLPGLAVTPFMEWLDVACIQFNYANMQAGRQPEVWSAFYTCNLSLSRHAFDQVGGFDENYPLPAAEDSDLGARLSQRGFVLDYRPDALAHHARAITLPEIRERMRKTARSKESFVLAHQDLGIAPRAIISRRRRALRNGKRLALRAAVAVLPRDIPTSVWSMHYRSEVSHAHEVGLRT